MKKQVGNEETKEAAQTSEAQCNPPVPQIRHCKSQQVGQPAPGSTWNSPAGATLKTHISKEVFWKKFFSSDSVMTYVPKAIPW